MKPWGCALAVAAIGSSVAGARAEGDQSYEALLRWIDSGRNIISSKRD
jgi:hypothetical protein